MESIEFATFLRDQFLHLVKISRHDKIFQEVPDRKLPANFGRNCVNLRSNSFNSPVVVGVQTRKLGLTNEESGEGCRRGNH